MKKAVSALLAFIMILSLAAPAFAESNTNNYPVIVIGGREKSVPIYDKEGNHVNDTDVSTEFVADAVMNCLPYLLAAEKTGDYQPWVDKVMEYYAPIYEKMLPDENGEITDGSRPEKVSDSSHCYTGYNGYDYVFKYDWRQDPYTQADFLHDNIQYIKKLKGVDKVSLVGRCYAGVIIGAYLDKYGSEDLCSVLFNSCATLGAEAAGCCFSNNIYFDINAIEAYCEMESLTGEPELDEIILSTLKFLNSFYIETGEKGTLTEIERSLYTKIASALFQCSFGRYASFWGMVSTEYFDDAKAIIFDTDEAREKYAGLIEKIDRYHKFQLNFEDKISELEKQGVTFAAVANYNRVLSPIVKNPKMQSDDTVDLYHASFGATVADFDSVLDVKGREADDPYISSDRIIDASTCMFPERTWFIKDHPHSNVSAPIDRMIVKICKDAAFNVNSDENYPRFMEWNNTEKVLSALDDEPIAVREKTKFEKIIDIIKNAINFIKTIFSFINSKIAE